MPRTTWPNLDIILAVQKQARNEGHPRPYRAALEASRPSKNGNTNPQHQHRYICWSKKAKIEIAWYQAHREKRRREKSQRSRKYVLIEKNNTFTRNLQLVPIEKV